MWLAGEAVLLVALAGLDGLDLGVLCERHEQRPCEVAIVLGEAEGEAGGVFQCLLAETGSVGGALRGAFAWSPADGSCRGR